MTTLNERFPVHDRLSSHTGPSLSGPPESQQEQAMPVRDMQGSSEMLESIRSYDALAPEYAGRYSTVDLQQLRDQFLSHLPRAPLPILDVGCGGGRDIAAFELSGLRTVGVDISREMLNHAKRHVRSPLVRANILSLPFKASSFRGVWSCASLVHLNLDEFYRAVREFSRILDRGGSAFISVRHGCGQEWRTDSAGGRRWFRLFQRDEVTGAMEAAGFTEVRASVQAGAAVGMWVNATGRIVR